MSPSTQPSLSKQPYKGTRDFYPEDCRIQRHLFETMRKVASRYCYQEYDGPMLEPFELYAAKTGEEIVNQQLYWLMDKGDRKLAVRPEMTPTLARMVAGKVNELPKPVRWFSIPNLWRYERPQRGRLREHWQLNIDVLGGNAGLADLEVLKLGFDLMREFGGQKFVSIKVNHRRLVDEVFQGKLGLSAETAHKALKALDARPKIGEEAYLKWLGELGVSESTHLSMETFFKTTLADLRAGEWGNGPGATEIVALFDRAAALDDTEFVQALVFDPSVMRGMDYYTGTVFEIFDLSPENRRAMFGGGRYDNLVGMFGGAELSGVGFGMGDVTLRHFLEVHGLLPSFGTFCDVFVSLPKPELLATTQKVAGLLRGAGLRVMTALEPSGFGAQLKLAAKHQARFAVLLGDDELARGEVAIKDLTAGSQVCVKLGELSAWGSALSK